MTTPVEANELLAINAPERRDLASKNEEAPNGVSSIVTRDEISKTLGVGQASASRGLYLGLQRGGDG